MATIAQEELTFEEYATRLQFLTAIAATIESKGASLEDILSDSQGTLSEDTTRPYLTAFSEALSEDNGIYACTNDAQKKKLGQYLHEANTGFYEMMPEDSLSRLMDFCVEGAKQILSGDKTLDPDYANQILENVSLVKTYVSEDRLVGFEEFEALYLKLVEAYGAPAKE
jgi:hypothetical protein